MIINIVAIHSDYYDYAGQIFRRFVIMHVIMIYGYQQNTIMRIFMIILMELS